MKIYKVFIWGNPLVCPICNQRLFSVKKIKITDHDTPISHVARYLFECEKCGYGMLFGAVTRWEPEEEMNFRLEEA